MKKKRVFDWNRLLDSILDLLGLLFGSLLAPKMAETCLDIRLGLAKSRSRAFFFGPGAPQEASKSAPYIPGSTPLAKQAFFRAPRGHQGASRASPDPPRPPWEAPEEASPGPPRCPGSLPRDPQDTSSKQRSIQDPRPGGMREAIKQENPIV